MDSNRRYSDEENPNPNPRHLQENQRIGRDKARQEGNRNWNEQYNSGQNYHNRNEGYGPDQTHYGSQPNSAYRDQNRINYGDNRGDRYNQDNRFNQNQHNQQNRYGNNRPENNNWRQDEDRRPPHNREYDRNPPYRDQSADNRRDHDNRDFNHPPQGDHGGTYFWGEREKYKEDDYRYRSGNRGNWHAGESLENDRNNDRNRRNYNDRDQEGGFFNRIGDSINNTWNNLTNSNDDDDRNNGRNRYSQNRNFNRGSERGPRWADESENDNYEQRRRNNRNNRDWD